MGTYGRRPNPDLIRAIKAWPAIRDLKDLQSFLGTANYVRAHAGPAYSRIMSPLRRQLKPGAVWPLTPDQLAAVEGLKGLMVEDHTLAVPDEEAAIRAAAAWQAGAPPAGRPYEGGADTSKIAMGGVLGQCDKANGKLRILMYWPAPLSPAQSPWHPLEQEVWGAATIKA